MIRRNEHDIVHNRIASSFSSRLPVMHGRPDTVDDTTVVAGITSKKTYTHRKHKLRTQTTQTDIETKGVVTRLTSGNDDTVRLYMRNTTTALPRSKKKEKQRRSWTELLVRLSCSCALVSREPHVSWLDHEHTILDRHHGDRAIQNLPRLLLVDQN
jgi:hypothetical protein